MRIPSTFSAVMLTFPILLTFAMNPAKGADRETAESPRFDEADALFGKRTGIKQTPPTPPGVPVPYPNTPGTNQDEKKVRSRTDARTGNVGSSRTRAISTGGSGGEDRRSR